MPADLEFVRTVDRSLLHRDALSEVFLTDVRQIAPDRYWAAAQLPPWHNYYTDHTSLLPVADPLLLMECCRQAETYGGHSFFGVPTGHRFILKGWSMSLPGLLTAPVAGRPTPLTIDVTTSGARLLGGRPRGLTYTMGLHLAGRWVGEVRIEVGYLPADLHTELRLQLRDGRPTPMSDQVDPAADDRLALPGLVGRSDPGNVVLADLAAGPAGATARLRVPSANPSMFDHPLDHVPGMVLLESARQLAQFSAATTRGLPIERTVLVGMRATHDQYAELDAPITLSARPDRTPVADIAVPGGTRTDWRVGVEQSGADIAELRISLATTETDGRVA